MKRTLAATLVMLCTLPVWAGCEGLQVTDAWIRSAPPGAEMMAGYATVKNTGGKARTIRDVRSTDFDSIGMHETVIEDGMSKMRMLDTVSIPAGGQRRFEPGGLHLMLFSPKREFKAGDTLRLTFSCGGKKTLTADFPVRDAP